MILEAALPKGCFKGLANGFSKGTSQETLEEPSLETLRVFFSHQGFVASIGDVPPVGRHMTLRVSLRKSPLESHVESPLRHFLGSLFGSLLGGHARESLFESPKKSR